MATWIVTAALSVLSLLYLKKVLCHHQPPKPFGRAPRTLRNDSAGRSIAMVDLAPTSRKIYDECCTDITRHYTTADLLTHIPSRDSQKLLESINELLQKGHLKTLKQGDSFVYRFVAQNDVEKLRQLTPDEALIYSHIESSARDGIWTKTLKTRTNFHPTVLNRLLRSLESSRHVKTIKSVKFPTRKIYMLYDLTPAIDVTGGPWFTDAELDQDFINALLDAIGRFIASKSWPKQSGGKDGWIPYAPGYTGYPTLSDITTWVKNSNLTEVELGDVDIRALLDVLTFEGRIEKVVGGTAYKAVRKGRGGGSGTAGGYTEAPCGKCPVFDLCCEDGPVNARNCVYFEKWLDENY